MAKQSLFDFILKRVKLLQEMRMVFLAIDMIGKSLPSLINFNI